MDWVSSIRNVDFVSILKASSIFLTGLFGVLGLLTEYKDKASGTITGWGKLSLFGIVTSAMLGILIQFKETQDQQKAQLSATEQAKDAAEQTKKIAEATSKAVNDINRSLSNLDNPRARMVLSVPCKKDPAYDNFCDAFTQYYKDNTEHIAEMAASNLTNYFNGSPTSQKISDDVLAKWQSSRPAANASTPIFFTVRLNFFLTWPDAQAFLNGGKKPSEWTISFRASSLTLKPSRNQSSLELSSYTVVKDNKHFDYYPSISFEAKAIDDYSTGKLQSVLNLPGTTVLVEAGFGYNNFIGGQYFSPRLISLHFSNGRSIQLECSNAEGITQQFSVYYVASVPNIPR